MKLSHSTERGFANLGGQKEGGQFQNCFVELNRRLITPILCPFEKINFSKTNGAALDRHTEQTARSNRSPVRHGSTAPTLVRAPPFLEDFCSEKEQIIQ